MVITACRAVNKDNDKNNPFAVAVWRWPRLEQSDARHYKEQQYHGSREPLLREPEVMLRVYWDPTTP